MDMNDESWPMNKDEAKKLYEQAEELDWRREYDYADRIRARADKLMQDPYARIPPF